MKFYSCKEVMLSKLLHFLMQNAITAIMEKQKRLMNRHHDTKFATLDRNIEARKIETSFAYHFFGNPQVIYDK